MELESFPDLGDEEEATDVFYFQKPQMTFWIEEDYGDAWWNENGGYTL